MRDGWKEVRLGDVCDITSSKRIFAKEYRTNGIPFYRGKEIIEKHQGKSVSSPLFIEEERFLEIAEKHGAPQPQDILLTSVGTLGIPYVVKSSEKFYFKDGNLTWLRNFRGSDSKFLYYWLLSPIGKTQINAKCIGSTQKALTIETLLSFTASLPPLPEQRAIAATLSCLDDKIELNNKISANLEAQAQAIFKSWFVDFEPFQDGEFVNSELGPIPKGWRIGWFTEIVNVLGGGTPKTDKTEYWEGTIPFFTPKDVNGTYTLQTEKYLTEDGLNNCNSRLYPVNTVFITARGTVGKLALSGKNMAMNQSCYALVGKDDYNQFFIYGIAQLVVSSLRHKSSGAVFNAIVTRDFDSEQIVIPDQKAVDDYGKVASTIFNQLLQKNNENLILAAIRDTVLPKLMNGELSVADLSNAK